MSIHDSSMDICETSHQTIKHKFIGPCLDVPMFIMLSNTVQNKYIALENVVFTEPQLLVVDDSGDIMTNYIDLSISLQRHPVMTDLLAMQKDEYYVLPLAFGERRMSRPYIFNLSLQFRTCLRLNMKYPLCDITPSSWIFNQRNIERRERKTDK